MSAVGDPDAEALAVAMAAQEQLLASDLAGHGVNAPDADMLLAMQLMQEGGASGAQVPLIGQSDMDADAILAMQLMQEDLQAQQGHGPS